MGGAEESIDPLVALATDYKDPVLASAGLVGGTAWLFSRPEHDSAFDYLFVDEAGQVALGNIVAMATAARILVLVGDPMQLGQPIQGVHPGDSGQSALEYLLACHQTIPPDRGIFFPESWRLQPDICRFISYLAYEGRLHSIEGAERQALVLDRADPRLAPSGIRFIEVDHEGRSQSSPEEAEIVATLYRSVLGQKFRDRDGRVRRMTADDILVVAPYNANVNQLQATLPACARVGTVDRFQGQEAPVSLLSLTTSSGQEVPRDVDFLFSRNRLNVALSRAQALAIVVASPRLLDVSCSTLDQMRLVNGFCALREYAGPITGRMG
jgi:superfamily I DNA and/or RNA helicase